MSDPRESIPILQDISSGEGEALSRAVQGDSYIGRNAHGALIAIDSLGRLKYLSLDEYGNLRVAVPTAAGNILDPLFPEHVVLDDLWAEPDAEVILDAGVAVKIFVTVAGNHFLKIPAGSIARYG